MSSGVIISNPVVITRGLRWTGRILPGLRFGIAWNHPEGLTAANRRQTSISSPDLKISTTGKLQAVYIFSCFVRYCLVISCKTGAAELREKRIRMNTEPKSDEQKALDFDAFLKLHGYEASTPDCSRLVGWRDCLSRGEQFPSCCESCRQFGEIADHWENIFERNANRVERGQSLVDLYKKMPSCDAEGDDETTLVDLLSDLRHWAGKNGVDFADALQSSEMHYEAEIGGEL